MIFVLLISIRIIIFFYNYYNFIYSFKRRSKEGWFTWGRDWNESLLKLQKIEQNLDNPLDHAGMWNESHLKFKVPPCNKTARRQSISVIKPKIKFPLLLRKIGISRVRVTTYRDTFKKKIRKQKWPMAYIHHMLNRYLITGPFKITQFEKIEEIWWHHFRAWPSTIIANMVERWGFCYRTK